MATSSQLALLRSRPVGTPLSRARGWLHAVHMGGMDSGVTSASTAPTQAATNINRIKSMEAWQGSRFGAVMDFCDSTTWSGMQGTDQRWLAVKAFSDEGYVPIITVAMLPTTVDQTKADAFTDLVTGAAGGYTAQWQALANRWVNNGLGNRRMIVRLGWEFNASNTPMSPFYVNRKLVDVNGVMSSDKTKAYPCNPTLDANASNRWQAILDFRAYWRKIVETVRTQLAVRGVNPWMVEWAMCPNVGHVTSAAYPSWSCYPGRQWVDLVGGDIYDTVAGSSTPYLQSGAVVTGTAMTTARATVWNSKRTGPFGLDWLAGFARSQGLKLIIGESSVSNQVDTTGSNPTGGQDNPNWWPNMNSWAWANADVMGVTTLYNVTVARENADFRVWDSANPSVANPVLPNAGAGYKSVKWPSTFGGAVAPGGSLLVPTVLTPSGYNASPYNQTGYNA